MGFKNKKYIHHIADSSLEHLTICLFDIKWLYKPMVIQTDNIHVTGLRKMDLILITLWSAGLLWTNLVNIVADDALTPGVARSSTTIILTMWNRDALIFRVNHINSLWSSYATWWQRSLSTLAQVMACCLMAPSHYLNRRWLIINKVQWHSYEGNFTRDTSPKLAWNLLI